jgi:hypothetical protein
VVLDRSIPVNAPGLKEDLLFVRCEDVKTFAVKRESWKPPAYRFAPNHLRELPPQDVEAATAQFEALQARWPEFEREVQRKCRETEERIEAIRVQEEKDKKQAASEKRKQAAAAKPERAAGAV